MKLYRNWIINEVARAGEHTNERTNVRTYVLTYIRTGQTLYPLHNFVVRGDNYTRRCKCTSGESKVGLVCVCVCVGGNICFSQRNIENGILCVFIRIASLG